MKFVSFLRNYKQLAGMEYNSNIYSIKDCADSLNLNLPAEMKKLLENWKNVQDDLKKVHKFIVDGNVETEIIKEEVTLLAPVPHPTSCRDAYAFRQHVATARRNRGVDMIPEFDQFPVFYFTNHNAVFGEGDVVVEEDHLQKLDFELEAAVIIGKKGRNIPVEEADSYIAGYTIMNDLSARRLQMEEMKLNLGPAKGKDFATVIGPYMVTTDELENNKIQSPEGNKYNLRMTAKHNGSLISEGNLKDMNWTFAQIIERASYGVDLYPGDVIGSGTVGTGCYLELNGTRALEAKEKGEEYTPVWLKDEDEIELEIQGIGILKNKIVKAENSYSILSKKKKI